MTTSQGRRWFEQRRDLVFDAPRAVEEPTPTPEEPAADQWSRCGGCGEMLFIDTLQADLGVCAGCGHHHAVDAIQRLRAFCDEGSVVLHDDHLQPVDALGFTDSKAYAWRIEQSRRKTGRNDAFVAVSAEVEGIPCEVGSFDFPYMGGSMGSVVGEVVTRLFERAAERKVPAIVISSSGGARMQEGVLSLMQMAKTCAALARLRDVANMPYVSVLTHPTTGGVAASFAMLGDLIVAEPKALIGFAGPRVIKETIGEELPEGFQTAEYLLANGMIDCIADRRELRPLVARLLRQLLRRPAASHGTPAEVP